MIIPTYWAEAKVRHRDPKGQRTIRRFGWSDVSEDDARVQAESRANEAMRRVLAGERLGQRETKVPYLGHEGLPIREEVLARHGEVVITRNSYGAHCLNTPHVLFADVDFERADDAMPRAVAQVGCLFVLLALGLGIVAESWLVGAITMVFGLMVAWPLGSALYRGFMRTRGGAEHVAHERVRRFAAAHPGVALRVYRTPAGLRVVATERLYDPRAPEVAALFKALETDLNYARMCVEQNCFRARVTPKPWRMGIEPHMKPQPGTWPVNPERLADRVAWITTYEAARGEFAACRFVERLGPDRVHPDVRATLELHDTLSGAHTEFPIA